MTEAEQLTFLSTITKNQMVLLGPSVAINIARKVKGLEITEDGIIVKITGDYENIKSQLINEFTKISGSIAQNIIDDLLNKKSV